MFKNEIITLLCILKIGGNCMCYNMYQESYGQFSVQKTLRFGLKPVASTLENIQRQGILLEDLKRAEDYRMVKQIIDRYHRNYIKKQLQDVELEGIQECYDLYSKSNRTDKEDAELKKWMISLRKQVSILLTSGEEFNRIDKKDLIEKDLLDFVAGNEEETEVIKSFKGFSTYFKGFFENRKNMYSDEEKSTAIGYRLVNQNMIRYFDNIKGLNKFMNVCPVHIVDEIEKTYAEILCGKKLKEFFALENYCSFLSQQGINAYNTILGGYNKEERKHVKGINSVINEFNQKNNTKLGILNPLYKQILSEGMKKSFLSETFEADQEVLDTIRESMEELDGNLTSIKKLFSKIEEYDPQGIYISKKSLNSVSAAVFQNWGTIAEALAQQYDYQYMGKKKPGTKAYDEEKRKYLSKQKSISVELINTALKQNVLKLYGDKIVETFERIDSSKEALEELVNTSYPENQKLSKDKPAVKKIKDYLDNLKQLQRYMQPLLGNKDEADKNDFFYGDFLKLWDELDKITPLYNKTRNYMTKKPYSTHKVKLNFANATLLNGWDLSKEEANTAIILRKDDVYYLGIMNKAHNKLFRNTDEIPTTKDVYQKMEYKLLPGANKMLPKVFFSKKGKETFNPPKEVLDIYERKSFLKGENFNRKDCHTLIAFYKKAIQEHPEWSKFDFQFSKSECYEDISQFYHEVEDQGYKIEFRSIDAEKIDQYVENGWLYLFQIWNKDFSEQSKGKPNLHTLYWKMLFDSQNLKNVVYKLNGEAEVFYREASILQEDIIIHPANKAIQNKNPQNEKKESIFSYDLIKDRRYTMDNFQFHVPITLNFKARGRGNINREAREYIKYAQNIHVIGIDRGERNLLYICVCDADGNIREQYSLNEIVNQYRGREYRVNYHELLEARETSRDVARRDWSEMESIKELKEGYISQVVHKICELMLKYNAIVVLEDLNSGFKNSRKKVEKQVYQKFEKMLIDKLNYLVDKNAGIDEPAGLLHALQLTSKFEGFNKLYGQSGLLFYVPAWNTSNIDPCTGFANLFESKSLRYSSRENAVEFWEKFDDICYDKEKDSFVFSFDYNNFNHRAEKSRSKWTVYTYGERIEVFRNPELNNQYDSREINLTEEFKLLCGKYGIDYENDLKAKILKCEEKDFFSHFVHLFKLTLQMRNSKPGTSIDYILSPVLNEENYFFDSREARKELPLDADANGAYNIARKGLWIIRKLQVTPKEYLMKAKIAVTNAEWLDFAQGNMEK